VTALYMRCSYTTAAWSGDARHAWTAVWCCF